MNVTRMAVLGVAFAAAGTAALLVRNGIGGAKKSAPQQISQLAATEDVLVAAREVAVGHALDASFVRWEAWPKSSVTPAYITRSKQADMAKAIEGAVARAPLVTGQPISDSNTVRAKATGFMAATITPGLRAIAVPVAPETSAGGFILPNDRVDIVLTRDISGGAGAKNFHSETVLKDVRVLAIDQTIQQEKDKQTVVGKTATLELMPAQAEVIAQAQQQGVLSLALRSLGDSEGVPVTSVPEKQVRPVPARIVSAAPTGSVVVYRYGVQQSQGGPGAGGGAPGANGEPATGAASLAGLGALP